MSLSQDQVIDYLSNLTVLQISDLVKQLEDKWGVKAASAVAVAAGPAPAAAAPAEEKTEFDVILKDGGGKKIDVIKALRAVVPGLALKEAKDQVEGAPTTLKTGVSKADAESLAKALREAGATVEIK